MNTRQSALSIASLPVALATLLAIFWASLALQTHAQVIVPKDTTYIEPRLGRGFFGDHRFDSHDKLDDLRFLGQHSVPYLPGETRVYELWPGVNITTTQQMSPHFSPLVNHQLIVRPRTSFAFDMNRLIGVPWPNPGAQWLVSPYFKRRVPQNPLRIDPRDRGSVGVRVIIVFPGH